MTSWRQKFCGQIKYASAWLHGRSVPQGVRIATNEEISLSDEEAIAMIRRFWVDFGSEAEANSPSTDEITRVLLQHTDTVDGMDLSPPNVSELTAVATSMGGCGGVDGWAGDELSALPVQFWPLFHALTMRWMSAGRVPEMILQARTVFLPKPHKVKDNKLQPADARPITICAAWWRLFASAWLHNS